MALSLPAGAAAKVGPHQYFTGVINGTDGNTVIPISTKQYGAYTSLRQIPGGGFLGYTEAQITTAGTAFDPNYQTPSSQATNFAFRADWVLDNVARIELV